MGQAVSEDALEDRYFLQKIQLGTGSSSTVWRGIERESGREVAIKQFSKLSMQVRGVSDEDIAREVNLMSTVKHENILELYGRFEDSRSIFLAVEYCEGGDFGDKVVERGMSITEAEAIQWVYQICSAILALHTQGICHRDIKPDNFMIKGSTLKLSDFGLACIVPSGVLLTDKIGTPAFMAPELVLLPNKSPGYGHPCDIWAAGVSMYMVMFGGRHPFFTSARRLDVSLLLQGRMEFRMASGNPSNGQFCIKRFSPEVRQLCRSMVRPNPAERISAQDATRHRVMGCSGPVPAMSEPLLPHRGDVSLPRGQSISEATLAPSFIGDGSFSAQRAALGKISDADRLSVLAKLAASRSESFATSKSESFATSKSESFASTSEIGNLPGFKWLLSQDFGIYGPPLQPTSAFASKASPACGAMLEGPGKRATTGPCGYSAKPKPSLMAGHVPITGPIAPPVAEPQGVSAVSIGHATSGSYAVPPSRSSSFSLDVLQAMNTGHMSSGSYVAPPCGSVVQQKNAGPMSSGSYVAPPSGSYATSGSLVPVSPPPTPNPGKSIPFHYVAPPSLPYANAKSHPESYAVPAMHTSSGSCVRTSSGSFVASPESCPPLPFQLPASNAGVIAAPSINVSLIPARRTSQRHHTSPPNFFSNVNEQVFVKCSQA